MTRRRSKSRASLSAANERREPSWWTRPDQTSDSQLRSSATALNAADARYLLVGGHAVGLYARPRATEDFDVWIEASRDNARRVLGALRDFGAPLGGLEEGDSAAPGVGFRMGEPPFRQKDNAVGGVVVVRMTTDGSSFTNQSEVYVETRDATS